MINSDRTARNWQKAIVAEAEAKLGRSLKSHESEFITSRSGYIALEMIHDTIKASRKEEIENYLGSESQKSGAQRLAPESRGEKPHAFQLNVRPYMKFKTFVSLEWDAIAGIVAAVVAIVLHLLHVVDEHVILPIVLALMALLFINFMRHTRNNELTAEQVDRTEHTVRRIQSELKPPDVILVGPRQLRSANEQFIRQMSGDTIWFNVCLSMYKPQPLFDALLRPAMDNPMVSSIQFILDESQRDSWQQVIQPRIAVCAGATKVREPRWCNLSKTVSFILADNQESGGTEALLSFWGEPFMAQTTARDEPRFIFHVRRNSELLPHLVELERSCARAHRQ